jgi:diguanylate cyclase (GGDEF)-like protein
MVGTAVFKSGLKGFSFAKVRSDDLVGEIERLREEVRTLRARVRELEEVAGIDELVGLPNRRSFLESLARLIDRVSRYDISAALIFVDVDGLKQINDSLGHVVGDAALTQIAQLLVEGIRKSDFVGRISGDEFGILLERTDELGAWERALRVVERVTASEFKPQGKRLRLSVAVGVGMIRSEDTPQEAIRRADEQMYRIKSSGVWTPAE